MRLVSNQKVFSIPWTVLLFGATVGEAILWEFAEAAPRPQLRLPALGVTPSPPRRPKLAFEFDIDIVYCCRAALHVTAVENSEAVAVGPG